MSILIVLINFFGFLNTETKESYKIDEPVKDEKSFDHKLPNLKFIDEFDPITFEAPKGCQSMLDDPFISDADDTITNKVTGFLRKENNYGVSEWYIRPYEEDEELDDEVESYLGYRENDGQGEE
ncbi:fam-a protein, fragment [Plasmodium vinckei]|uniref:Fam-a protein n=1 Tax=Plasmodium vinckei TaxID=5860 RepID=A0A6V7T257_PLAVN|nr:fam-a protein, fragment [Plasmodium vinckei]